MARGVDSGDCAICLQPLQDALTLNCGHLFCRPCVAGYKRRGPNDACPLCREPLPPGAGQLCSELDVLYARLDTHLTRGSLAEAAAARRAILAAATEAVALDPNHMQAHLELGYALEDAGDLTAAAAQLRAAIRAFDVIHDSSLLRANTHNNLGSILSQEGDLEGAEREIQQSLQLSETACAHVNLGIVMKKRGELARAEVECQAALRIDPNRSEAHCNLGNLKRARGDMEGAAVHLRTAVRLIPNCSASHANLAQVLLRMDELEEAEREYHEAIRCDPDCTRCGLSTLQELGVVLMRRGDTDGARATWQKVLQVDPDGGAAEYARRNLARLDYE